ncbi:unnamed protein product [Arabis nemorensis]|uniref:SWIM-type domain-containing protein n=1 Tax=Arabis nemorensis TaxID=586526 RepID=A0A565APX3_9BRAS|nr:unnamed protein product [Arabis nemorensis]
MAILEKARIDNKYCETIRSSTNLYEVVEFNKGYTVRLDSHECACRRWDLTVVRMRKLLWRDQKIKRPTPKTSKRRDSETSYITKEEETDHYKYQQHSACPAG